MDGAGPGAWCPVVDAALRSHVAGMVGDAKNDIAKGHPAGVARLGMQDTGT